MKCLRILPEMCASTWCWLSSSSTRNIALGRVSRTLAMTSIASSFAIQPQGAIHLYWQTSDSSMPLKQLPSRSPTSSGSRNLRVRGRFFFNQRKNFRTCFSDGDRVLDVRARLPIDGHDRPAIRQSFRVVRPEINHRFDRKYVAPPDLRTLPGFAVIRNLRVLVHATADAMADIFANN